MMLDYKVIMLSDGTAALTDEEHAGALNTFIMFFGDVMTTDEVIGRLRLNSPTAKPVKGSDRRAGAIPR
jgi:ureidoacrylate peracid hydrolase